MAAVSLWEVNLSKSAVRDFWDAAACGEIYARGETLEQQFAAHAETRYSLEPYLRDFARFDGRGRSVLEVGVGMGADHVEWARSGPSRLVGLDFTPRAINWTGKRIAAAGYQSELLVADAERLPFTDASFDIVYSWGVLHHTPDTSHAFREVRRVLRPGGTLRAMIYHRPSLVGLMLWSRYALLGGTPRRSVNDMYAEHLESPGTKGYTIAEGRDLVRLFTRADVRPQVSLGDLLEGAVGQQHDSSFLRIAKKIWPRPMVRRLNSLGLFLLIEAVK